MKVDGCCSLFWLFWSFLYLRICQKTNLVKCFPQGDSKVRPFCVWLVSLRRVGSSVCLPVPEFSLASLPLAVEGIEGHEMYYIVEQPNPPDEMLSEMSPSFVLAVLFFFLHDR